ncbi:MAG: exodeoxyribonuclease VII large subunit [Desulfonauticus sp.]|nr:exodeoxyribonuclease VII large subunit [Desulfonauticus sp.]
MPHIFSVSELTESIKNVLESNFPFVWVRGQISNYSPVSSGHVYFTLKDEQACLEAVWFRGNQRFFSDQQGKSLKESLKDGQEVICAGRLNVYPPRGRYQIIVEFIQEVGVGDLFLAFEKLKQKLSQEGLFSEKFKKEIPFNPSKVGVITALNSAALKDFLTVCSQYGLSKEIIIYPSSVQGEESIGQLVQAIERANQETKVQVLVLIRGGGSIEDLWSFNTEEVARAIFRSQIPVVTGIGHEIDTTIADLVADKRASTPSHVPQLLWVKRDELVKNLTKMEQNLWLAIDNFLFKKEVLLRNIEKNISFLSPTQKIAQARDKLVLCQSELISRFKLFLNQKEQKLLDLKQTLQLSYNLDRLNLKAQQLKQLESKLRQNLTNFLSARENKFQLLLQQITSLDPYLPLQRGYSIVRVRPNNKIVTSTRQMSKGLVVEIRVKDGSKEAIIL